MEHTITCREARPLWLQTLALLKDMGEQGLDDPSPTAILTTVVTNLDNQQKPTSDSTRAILRTAFRQHYAAIVRTDTEKSKYEWKRVYFHTLQAIRTLAIARGERTALRIRRAHYTSRPVLISKAEYESTEPLLILDDQTIGQYEIHDSLKKELEKMSTAIHKTTKNTDSHPRT